jgi:hypothetical protein
MSRASTPDPGGSCGSNKGQEFEIGGYTVGGNGFDAFRGASIIDRTGVLPGTFITLLF